MLQREGPPLIVTRATGVAGENVLVVYSGENAKTALDDAFLLTMRRLFAGPFVRDLTAAAPPANVPPQPAVTLGTPKS